MIVDQAAPAIEERGERTGFPRAGEAAKITRVNGRVPSVVFEILIEYRHRVRCDLTGDA